MRRPLWLLPLTVFAIACAGPDHIEIEPKEVVLKRPKETIALRGKVMNRRGNHWADKRCDWLSSDASVATVDAMGVVTAHKSGRTLLTASYDGLKAEVPVEVTLVEELRAEPAELVLFTDSEDSTKIRVTVLGPNGKALSDRSIRYLSNDEKVATIDGGGGVWTHNPGETLVRAVCENHEVTVKVKVEAPKPVPKAGRKVEFERR